MNFEQLRMIDLIEKFDGDIQRVYDDRNLSVFTGASAKLQSVYNFYVTAEEGFSSVESYLKNLFSSFNYAAVIINDAMKKKKLDDEAKELLFECLQIMLKCDQLIISTLKGPEQS